MRSLKFLFFFLILFLFSDPLFSKDLSFNLKTGSFFIIKADRIVINNKKKCIEAFGNVYFKHKKGWFKADYGKYFWEIKKVLLKQNVYVKTDEGYLKGEEVFLDLNKNTGWVKRGEIFFKKSHIYIRGKRLEKTGKFSFRFKNLKATSCDSSPPPWQIKAKKGYISKRGYAHLWHVKFCLKKYPILYSPYLLIPIKRKRESGFLIPEIKTSSRNGTEINLPYYQVISKEQDFTFYTHYISKRGTMLEGEYRFFPNIATKGIFFLSWLKDKEKDETELEEDNQFRGDGFVRPNKDRFWLRGKLDGFVYSPEWKLKLDLDFVSDQNYLREFDSRFTGYEKLSSIFLKQFGRDIDKKDSFQRKNLISISRDWENFGIELKGVYTQDLRYRNHNLDPKDNPTVQKIPEINLYLYPLRIKNSGFQVKGNTSFSYLWRKKGINAERINIDPTLFYEYINPYFRLTPSFSLYERLYFTKSSRVHQPVPRFDLDLFTQLFRDFDVSFRDWTRLRHTMKPEVKYSYIPEVYQDDLPYFDGNDRIKPISKIIYSLTNLFTLKSDKSKKSCEFLYFKVEQSYDFKEASREKDLDKYPKRPFSDIKSELRITPKKSLSFINKNWYSPYLHTITENEMSFYLSLKRADFSISYDYLKELKDDIRRKDQQKVDNLKILTKFAITPNYSFKYEGERDFVENKMIKQIFTLSYTHQCWSASFVADIRRDDRRFMILINLNQIGEIGGSFYGE